METGLGMDRGTGMYNCRRVPALFDHRHSRCLVQCLVVLAVGCMSIGGAEAQQSPYVRIEQGSMPLILAMPHGGSVRPNGIPDRDCPACVTVKDLWTFEIGLAIADALERRTGQRPYVVANLLHRTKLDANRDLPEAALGNAEAELAWQTYHGALAQFRQQMELTFGFGVLADLHGHGHTRQRLELGYLLTAAELRLTDAALDASGSGTTSLTALESWSQSAETLSGLIRGSVSLGSLFTERGYAAVPSAADPAPLPGESFFSGGYTTRVHGSLDGGQIDAVQIEMNMDGVRDTPASREAFADSASLVLMDWLDIHHAWNPIIDTATQNEYVRPELSFDIVPHPVTPASFAHLSVPVDGTVRVDVFDASGRRVHRLLDTYVTAGRHRIPMGGARLHAGMYVVRAVVGGQTTSRTFVVVSGQP